jgi:HEAT repeat protein
MQVRWIAALVTTALAFAPVAAAQDVAALLKQLVSKRTEDRLAGANGLATLGPKAAAAGSALANALADDDAMVRKAAGRALGSIGKAAMPRIKAAFGDTARASAAAVALGELGPQGAPLVPDLLAVFARGTGGAELSENAGAACIAIGAEAVPHLVKGLKERALATRAAELLREMRAVAAPAAQPLLDLALDRTHLPGSRSPAFGALGAIGKPARPLVPKLLAFVCDPKQEGGLRGQAVQAIGAIGSDDPAAVRAALQPFAADPDENFASRVRHTITALK